MNETDEATKKMVLAEAEVMSKVDHPNVLKVIKYGEGMFKSNTGSKEKKMCFIALELC